MSVLEINESDIFSERTTLFADVLLPLPIPKLYTYRIPFELNDRIDTGFRVIVQFGARRVITGVIIHLHENPPKEYKAKYIMDVLDQEAHFNARQFEFYSWIADYYMTTTGEVLNIGLPSGLKLSSESKIQLHPEFDPEETAYEFSDKEHRLLSVLKREQTLSYSDVERILEMKTYISVIKSLIAKMAILIYEEVKEKYNPKKETYVRLNNIWLDGKLESLMEQLESRPKQLDVLLAYLQNVPVFNNPSSNNKGVSKKTLMGTKNLSSSSYNTLIKNKIFEQYDLIVPRFVANEASDPAGPTLTDPQVQARDKILTQFEKKQSVLLHGITGSGKTEIYIDLIKEVLENGGQVLFLLPEIALTTQIVSRLKKVFGSVMGVYHSKFSDNERVEVWKGLLSGQFSLILGVRSSVFLPFDNLGLIIVDEEHEPSYKQFDPAPRYNARDVVQVLAKIHSAKVLLGSATPSFESYYLAQEGMYGYVELNERFGSASLPEIEFADTLMERKHKTLKGDFTSRLLEQIAAVLATKHQVIIFQNRRGYSPYVTCEACNWIPKCNQCAVSLTYHMHYNQLQCHYCGHHERVPATCPACGSTHLKTMGFGTEKLEEDLKLFFPETRIQRMDLDTTRRKYSYQKIINDFENGDIDILVGTQMVSKGLDFDRVSLVGIVEVDRMLHFPDFRSHERTFQLSVQVSGRAGRKETPGKVIIQSADVQQLILKQIRSQDYRAFYLSEITDRDKFKYPPFYRLIKIIMKHKDKEVADKGAERVTQMIRNRLGGIDVLGPYEPVISRIRNLYLMEGMIKIPRAGSKLKLIKEQLLYVANKIRGDKLYKQLWIVFDVDPL